MAWILPCLRKWFSFPGTKRHTVSQEFCILTWKTHDACLSSKLLGLRDMCHRIFRLEYMSGSTMPDQAENNHRLIWCHLVYIWYHYDEMIESLNVSHGEKLIWRGKGGKQADVILGMGFCQEKYPGLWTYYNVRPELMSVASVRFDVDV